MKWLLQLLGQAWSQPRSHEAIMHQISLLPEHATHKMFFHLYITSTAEAGWGGRCGLRIFYGRTSQWHYYAIRIQKEEEEYYNQSIKYLMSWGSTDKSSVQWIHTDKISFLYAKQSLRKPPHALGSHKDKKSATVQQYWRRFTCLTLIWSYAGQSKIKCCSSSTHPGELQTKQPLSTSTSLTQRSVSTWRPWQPVLNLLISLLSDAHLIVER